MVTITSSRIYRTRQQFILELLLFSGASLNCYCSEVWIKTLVTVIEISAKIYVLAYTYVCLLFDLLVPAIIA